GDPRGAVRGRADRVGVTRVEHHQHPRLRCHFDLAGGLEELRVVVVEALAGVLLELGLPEVVPDDQLTAFARRVEEEVPGELAADPLNRPALAVARAPVGVDRDATAATLAEDAGEVGAAVLFGEAGAAG